MYIDLVRNVGFTVDLFQGKVVEKGDSRPWPVVYPSDPPGGNPPPKPAGTLTRASFDKIDKGMSMDDVVALLGQPKVAIQQDPARFGGVDTELTFTNFGAGAPPAAATVDLFKGKVVKKSSSQNWRVVYPSDSGKYRRLPRPVPVFQSLAPPERLRAAQRSRAPMRSRSSAVRTRSFRADVNTNSRSSANRP